MKYLQVFFSLLMFLCFSSLAFSAEATESANPAPKKEQLKNGECFDYTDGKIPGSEWVKGKVHHLNLATFHLEGFLFAKVKGKNDFHVFKFEMAFGKQYNYKKVRCPKSLDAYDKAHLQNI